MVWRNIPNETGRNAYSDIAQLLFHQAHAMNGKYTCTHQHNQFYGGKRTELELALTLPILLFRGLCYWQSQLINLVPIAGVKRPKLRYHEHAQNQSFLSTTK